jgi:hypothetical protein
MKHFGYSILPALALAALAATTASATPVPNSAVIHERVFNDCPISILTSTNLFPALIKIDDQNQLPPFCAGFANLHTWRFSTDGVNAIQFLNGDAFQYSAIFTINGVGEGGLSMSPWFSPDADGQFNVRSTDGEIACFGGRMPFYSFTGSQGLVYVNNTPIFLEIIYNPRGLSSVSPAQITYNIRYNAINYTSGPLNFDEGNIAEDPPHGLWGALNPWYAGGHMKMFVQTIGQPHGAIGTWENIQYNSDPTPATPKSWGKIKADYR